MYTSVAFLYACIGFLAVDVVEVSLDPQDFGPSASIGKFLLKYCAFQQREKIVTPLAR